MLMYRSMFLPALFVIVSFGFSQVSTHGFRGFYVPAYGSSGAANLSTAEECARPCKQDAEPLYCYYKFTIEYYVTRSGACAYCKPNSTNQLGNTPNCQCIEADGIERGVTSINRMLPGPSIQVCKNDKVVIEIENNAPGLETTIHWHGIFQKGSQYFDGVPYVTQCPIHSDSIFRYRFIAGNSGTHFYHSHSGLQKLDGVHGSLIVREPLATEPHASLYDKDLPEHVIVLSDWLHEMAVERFPGRLTTNPGQEPDNVLINGKGRWTDTTTGVETDVDYSRFEVEEGVNYRFRLVSAIGSNCPVQLTIQGHTLTLIAQDGAPVKGKPVNSITTHSGERADFVLSANQSVDAYWIQVRSLSPCTTTRPNQLAILSYKGGPDTPTATTPTYDAPLDSGIVYNGAGSGCNGTNASIICANELVAVEKISKKILKGTSDKRITLAVGFHAYDSATLFTPGTYTRFTALESGSYVSAIIDDISFKFPSVPLLSQNTTDGVELCNRNEMPKNCSSPCLCTHNYDIDLGDIVDILIYDTMGIGLVHPFHLHGYVFHILKMGLLAAPRNVTQADLDKIWEEHNATLASGGYSAPPAKDTLPLPSGGYAIIRFEADNPGWWYFHCHILWHMDIGMDIIINVGEKSDIPPVPFDFPRCGYFKPDPHSLDYEWWWG